MSNKLLHTLLKALPEFKDGKLLADYKNIEVSGVKLDSRQIVPGDLFIAYNGTKLDGRDYIKQAITNGAKVVLYEQYLENGLYQLHSSTRAYQNVIFIPVANLDKYISVIAAAFFDQPSANQVVYAVTGTNGKTTCSFLLAQLLYLLNYTNPNKQKGDVGLIGTVGYGSVNKIINDGFYNKLNTTTPDPVQMQQILADYNKQNISHVALEASSHALDQHRLSAVNISTAIFTNLTHDHLDYHNTLDNYYLAKQKLFYFPTIKNWIINIDDEYGAKLLSNFFINKAAHNPKIGLYGFSDNERSQSVISSLKNKNIVTLFCKKIITANKKEHDAAYGLELELILNDISKNFYQTFNVTTHLFGRFNISNLMAVILSLYLNSYDLSEITHYTSELLAAPGRAEVFYCKARKVSVIVDYAHTPDALEQILITLRSQVQGQIWCVFGCGGDRDKSKRPKMGTVAAKYSDHLIVTDDNPRTEDPQNIVNEILTGIKHDDVKNSKSVDIIHDRKQAISTALSSAAAGDIILVSGKGHEDYQVYGSKKIDYNEREFVRSLVN